MEAAGRRELRVCEPVRMRHPSWRAVQTEEMRGCQGPGGPGARPEVTVKRYGVSFGGSEDVLKLVVVVDAELRRY